MRNQSSILSISVAVTLSFILSQIVITQVNSAVSSFRVYRNVQIPEDFIIPLILSNPPSPVSETKSAPFTTKETLLPNSSENNKTANGISDGTVPAILRRRRIKGKRRTTPSDSAESSTATIETTTETEIFTTETTEPSITVSGVLENMQEIITVPPPLNDGKNDTLLASGQNDTSASGQNDTLLASGQNETLSIAQNDTLPTPTVVYLDPKGKDTYDMRHTTENNKEIFSSTFEDLFSPLPIDHGIISERRKNMTISYEYNNLDHLTQFKDNGNETDLHISESSNPYINSSTPISTELQKSLQFEYLHPILSSDNIITNAEQKIPDNKTIIIQNALSSSLVNTPIAHDVRHSPGHLRKKHPLLNHDSIISSDFAKNGPRLDVPVPIVPKITNSIHSEEQIVKPNNNHWPEHTSKKPFFPTSTVQDDDYGQGGFTVLLPKDFESMENTEKTASLDPIKHFGGIESTTKFNTYVRQTEPQNSIMPVLSLNTPQLKSTSQEQQLNEFELLQQLLGIEKSLSQINLPNQPQQTSSESLSPQISNQSNEEDLKALLQLPEFSFLDTILNPSKSTTSTTKKPTTTATSTEVPSKKDKNTGLSDADLRSIYYMLERMVVHSNNSSTTAKPVMTTTSVKPTTPSTTSASPTLFPSFDSIFNMFTTPGQTTQEKRNAAPAPGPVYKHPNSSPGPRNLDGNSGNTNAGGTPAVLTPQTQQKAGDNSLDLLTQLLQLSIAAESANANKPVRATPAPAIPLDLLTLLANSNLGGQTGQSALVPPPATQQKPPEISPSETMQLLNIFSNQNVQKPNGLYYWLDLNAFLGGDPTADPLSGIRPKLGHREHFVKVRSLP